MLQFTHSDTVFSIGDNGIVKAQNTIVGIIAVPTVSDDRYHVTSSESGNTYSYKKVDFNSHTEAMAILAQGLAVGSH